MRLHTRLQRLERSVGAAGCPDCQERRGRVALVQAETLPDGIVVSLAAEPFSCARCGQIPETIIQILETVVDCPADKNAALADVTSPARTGRAPAARSSR